MSWLRSAVHRAVEASGGRSSLLTRTVRTSLDTVVHHAGQAVAGGARLITGSRSYKSVRVTAKMLEEAALSYKGEERMQLLRRWLVALKETQRAATAMREPQLGQYTDQNAPLMVSVPGRCLSLHTFFDSHCVVLTPDRRRRVRDLQDLYVDYERGAELMNFFHVFLYSQALECVVLSMILEAPTDEEVSLISEIFRQVIQPLIGCLVMCLSGGKDVHSALLSSLKDMARLFSSYHDEVLAKRDELLRFAQGAVSGLKINADIARLDNEIVQLQQQINSMDALRATSTSNQNKTSQTVTEVFKKAVAEVRLCSRLEELVLKKKSIHPGDSLETHFEKA
ncbi:hypothetical protein U9M48_007023 [Paspalum notatum var. saurae]|uniref:Uncharacterized protein n=1 Tax=Paspalum notatum var. saurae TaxID=547442 RepID=A0AAQ3SJZ3_PASNO